MEVLAVSPLQFVNAAVSVLIELALLFDDSLVGFLFFLAFPLWLDRAPLLFDCHIRLEVFLFDLIDFLGQLRFHNAELEAFLVMSLRL